MNGCNLWRRAHLWRATLAPPHFRRISTALPVDDGAGQWRLRGPHDVGGQASLLQGPLDVSGRSAPAFWECRTHALLVELAATEKITVDELRRGIEELDKQRYRSWGYYDKWAASIATIALERGLLTEGELDDAIGRDRGGVATSFAVGDPVRVLRDTPGATLRWRRPHIRCPGYVFGAVGLRLSLTPDPNPYPNLNPNPKVRLRSGGSGRALRRSLRRPRACRLSRPRAAAG